MSDNQLPFLDLLLKPTTPTTNYFHPLQKNRLTLISHLHFVTSRPMQELGPLQQVSAPQTNMQ